MTPLRVWMLAILVVAVGACRDAVAPLDQPAAVADVVAAPPTPPDELHILQQAATAPALETYQVSFWARRDRASRVAVDYVAAPGATVGQPFLRFEIPRDGLRSLPNQQHLGRGDSVLITLTIDPQDFSVDFEPSGVVFSRRHPAILAIWYGNANPDLNGDGAVDDTDEALVAQLSIWGRHARPAPWMKTASLTGQQWVWGPLRHFSEYAVSW